MRKEGTDVGWRLRADLHQDGDPGSLLLGRRLRRESGVAEPSARLRPRAGSTGRSRDRKPMRLARRSCDPVDREVDVTRFECWWPAAGGNPESVGRVSRELAKRPAPRAPRKRRLRAAPEGRKCPAVARRTCSVAPRHAGGVPHSSTRVRPSGDGFRRFGHERSGGSRPQRWGTAADEEQTFEGCGAGGDEDLVRSVFGW